MTYRANSAGVFTGAARLIEATLVNASRES